MLSESSSDDLTTTTSDDSSSRSSNRDSRDNVTRRKRSNRDSRDYMTPRKKRYRKSIRDGVSAKLANYYKSTEQKSDPVLVRPAAVVAHATSQRQSLVSETLDFAILGTESYLSSPSPSTSASTEDLTNSSESESSYHSRDNSSDSEWSSSDSNTDHDQSDSDRSSHTGNISSADDGTEQSEAHSFLFGGCKHTYLTSYTLVMLFVMKHGLSKEAFTDLLLLICSHLPSACNYAKSVYKLKEFLKGFIKIKSPKVHSFCEHCQQLLGNQTTCASNACRRKNAKVMEFHDLHLENQLTELFQDNEVLKMVSNYIQSSQEGNQGKLKDICDGSRYRELMTGRSGVDRTLNLTFTMNTDGVAIFSSSKKGSLWPIYIAINEIPVKLRFSKKFILPSFLYCHSEKPNMMTYMAPMMDILKKLSEEGLAVSTHMGRLLIKVHLIAVTVDLPARAMVANMKQFNGKFGCSFCLDEGKSRPNCPMHRFWPYKESSILRTHQSYMDNLTEAVQSSNTVNGIKGACPLVVLHYVDIPKVFVIDWMHCVLLGVTKSLMKLWFSGGHRGCNYYVGDKLPYLNQRLKKIDVPDFMSRTQRSLEDHAHWKATEFREWLFHFSVPVLEGVLPPMNLVHYMLLVSAMHLLNKEEVLLDEINNAEGLLVDFCKMYSEVYGDVQQTMNVHMLKHLPEFVRLYGPLFVTSCFGFESMNAHLKRMIHGTRFINNQVSFAVGITKSLPQLVRNIQVENQDKDLQNLVDRLSSQILRGYAEDPENACNIKIVGKVKGYVPNEEESRAIEDSGENGTQIFQFFRLRKDSDTYYSKDYNRVKIRNSYTVLLNNGEYGIVLYYLSIGNNLYAMVRKLDTIDLVFPVFDDVIMENAVLRKYHDLQLCTHIRDVRSEIHLQLVPASNILKKCVYMNFGPRNTYVSVPPNLLEHS